MKNFRFHWRWIKKFFSKKGFLKNFATSVKKGICEIYFEDECHLPLPSSKDQSRSAIIWIKQKTSAKEVEDAVNGTPFSSDIVCGIACQETAYEWSNWIDKNSVDEILSLCVFDASGDFPDTKRSAFPGNTEAFRSIY